MSIPVYLDFSYILTDETPINQPPYFRLTFPEPNRPVITYGPGDHTVTRIELTMDNLRGLVRDAIPNLL